MASKQKNDRAITPSSDPETFVTLREARQVMPLSMATLYRRFEDGSLKKYKASGKTLVKLGDVLGLCKEE